MLVVCSWREEAISFDRGRKSFVEKSDSNIGTGIIFAFSKGDDLDDLSAMDGACAIMKGNRVIDFYRIVGCVDNMAWSDGSASLLLAPRDPGKINSTRPAMIPLRSGTFAILSED